MLLNSAGREADKLRVFQKLDKLPTLSFTMFCIGNFALIFGGGFSISVVYGIAAQIIWSCVLSLFCGVLFLFLNAKILLPIGHISHGWYVKNKEDFLENIDKVIDKLDQFTNDGNNEEGIHNFLNRAEISLTKNKDNNEQKIKQSPRIPYQQLEMKNNSFSTVINPNEISLSKIQKETSFLERFSETNRKLVERDMDEEKYNERTEISSLKHEIHKIRELLKASEQKTNDLELEIEHLKILNLVQQNEIKIWKQNFEKTQNQEAINPLEIQDSKDLKDISPSIMDSLMPNKVKGYFEEKGDIVEEKSKKDCINIKENLEQNKDFMKIWDHQENNSSN